MAAIEFPRLRTGSGAALGFVVGIATTILAALVDAVVQVNIGLFVVGIGVIAVSSITTVVGAVLTAIQGWGLYAGFLLGKLGNVPFTVESLRLAAVLVGVAVLVSAIAAVSSLLAAQPVPIAQKVPFLARF